MRTSRPALLAFIAPAYQIFDKGLIARGEVVIHADGGDAPAIGDSFIVERDGHAHDVDVCEVHEAARGWSALCRVRGWV